MTYVKKLVSRLFALIAIGLFSSLTVAEASRDAAAVDLLEMAKSIVKTDAMLNQKREELFALKYEAQMELLGESERRLLAAEREQERLKKLFDQNEDQLAELETKLSQRSGALGEVFGVAKESALELVPMLQDSITSADHPNRAKALAFAESKRIPTIKEFSALLRELSVELRATGQVSTFEVPVIDETGQLSETSVTRFGVFSSITSDGDYLAWDIPQQKLKVLATQPESIAFNGMQGDSAVVLMDPSRGELFALLDRMPTLLQRIEQGGTVGYFIISLGVLGVLVAVYQIARLLLTEVGVRQQMSSQSVLKSNNPLGRVLSAVKDTTSSMDDDKIEMRVDEAILKELPKIEQGQSFLKLLAAVAPLLGLLGTVVGMIATFQSITLFGTSDPKLMANGISQALMTTVLGLVVAVPVLFCHSLLVARGRRLVQILQEKSLGALADVVIDDCAPNDKGSGLHVA